MDLQFLQLFKLWNGNITGVPRDRMISVLPSISLTFIYASRDPASRWLGWWCWGQGNDLETIRDKRKQTMMGVITGGLHKWSSWENFINNRLRRSWKILRLLHLFKADDKPCHSISHFSCIIDYFYFRQPAGLTSFSAKSS